MTDHMRRVVAFVAGRLVVGKAGNGVYDQSAGKQFTFSGEFNTTKLALRDHDQACDFTGMGGSGLFTLMHPVNGKPISLKVNGNSFEGFDYGCSKKYRGNVNGNHVSVHDDQVGQQFSFTL
jgi:hypothetical protein